MKTTCRFLVSALALFGLTSCDLIDYHPYDTRVDGAHNINARNIARIEEACRGREELRFVLISDTQRWYDETEAAVKSINALPNVDFVIHCGDISDFGVTKEMELQRDILEGLRVPYVVLIGNHDCLGTGADLFRYLFGAADFSFDAGNTHFVCLNTNAIEYDYSTPVPNFGFIREDREAVSADVSRTVVAMHAQPFSDQFNNNVAEVFQYELRKYPSLSFCVCGHGHKLQAVDHFGDGVLYHEVSAAEQRTYILFTLTKDGGYTHENIQY